MGVNTLPYNSSGAARFGIHQLALTVDNVQSRLQLVQNVVAEIGPCPIAFTSAAYPDYPAWAVIGNNTAVYVFIAGISLPVHAAAIAAQIVAPAAAYPNQGCGAFYDSAASRIFGLSRMGAINTQELRIVGHSAGGCIGLALLGYLATQNVFPSTRSVLSFGSPKPGTADFTGALRGKRFTRMFLPIDPVPLFPPSLDDTLASGTVLTAPFVRTSSLFVQPNGGVELTGQFAFADQVIPSQARITPFTSLADWILNYDQGGAGLHSVQAYTIWFDGQFQASQGGGDWDTPTRESGPQLVTAPNSQQQNAYETRVRNAISAQAAIQNVQPVSVPKIVQLQAVNIGGQWAVVFGTDIVTIEASKKHARAVARLGNIWLDRVLTSAVVSPSALISNLTQFLQSAQDPTSGISPTLNTSLTF